MQFSHLNNFLVEEHSFISVTLECTWKFHVHSSVTSKCRGGMEEYQSPSAHWEERLFWLSFCLDMLTVTFLEQATLKLPNSILFSSLITRYLAQRSPVPLQASINSRRTPAGSSSGLMLCFNFRSCISADGNGSETSQDSVPQHEVWNNTIQSNPHMRNHTAHHF